MVLIISKPTVFAPDGFAVRGQCSPDSPGWQLRWFNRGDALTVIWQGAFKTCRHLQTECVDAQTADEAKKMVDELLKSNAFTRFNSMPTDIYPAARSGEAAIGGAYEGEHKTGRANKKRRKRKRH